MATLFVTILIKLEKPTFIPFSIVLGFCLDGIIVYNLLKV